MYRTQIHFKYYFVEGILSLNNNESIHTQYIKKHVSLIWFYCVCVCLCVHECDVLQQITKKNVPYTNTAWLWKKKQKERISIKKFSYQLFILFFCSCWLVGCWYEWCVWDEWMELSFLFTLLLLLFLLLLLLVFSATMMYRNVGPCMYKIKWYQNTQIIILHFFCFCCWIVLVSLLYTEFLSVCAVATFREMKYMTLIFFCCCSLYYFFSVIRIIHLTNQPLHPKRNLVSVQQLCVSPHLFVTYTHAFCTDYKPLQTLPIVKKYIYCIVEGRKKMEDKGRKKCTTINTQIHTHTPEKKWNVCYKWCKYT